MRNKRKIGTWHRYKAPSSLHECTMECTITPSHYTMSSTLGNVSARAAPWTPLRIPTANPLKPGISGRANKATRIRVTQPRLNGSFARASPFAESAWDGPCMLRYRGSRIWDVSSGVREGKHECDIDKSIERRSKEKECETVMGKEATKGRSTTHAIW